MNNREGRKCCTKQYENLTYVPAFNMALKRFLLVLTDIELKKDDFVPQDREGDGDPGIRCSCFQAGIARMISHHRLK